jgi:hypothetical protein
MSSTANIWPLLEGLHNGDEPGCAADGPNRIINIFSSVPLQVKNTRKSSQRLKDCLMEMNLAVLLMVLTGLLIFSLLNTRKSSQRLKDCLMEMNLAVPLVLLIAQQGNCVVYQETEKDHSLKN